MVPRKTLKAVAPGEQKTIRPTRTPSQLDQDTEAAIREEHRQDMVASGIVSAAEMPPPATAKKTVPKTNSTAKKRQAPVEEIPSGTPAEPSLESSGDLPPPGKKKRDSAQDRASSETALFEKRKADESDATQYPSPDSDDVENETPQAAKEHKKAASRKRKAATQSRAESDVPSGQEAVSDLPPAKSTRKRKAESVVDKNESAKDAEAAEPIVKKPKRASPRTKKTAAGVEAPKASKKGKGKKENVKNESSSLPPTPPPPPALINEAVARKLGEVHAFIVNEEESKLDRDPDHKDLITMPEEELVGAVMTMRIHYEVGHQQEASVSDVDETIVNRFKRPIGWSEEDHDWVTINIPNSTKFEEGIQKKIARHGLDDVSLLEIELELRKRDLIRWAGLEKKEVMWTAERFLDTFEGIWDKIEEVEKKKEKKEGVDAGAPGDLSLVDEPAGAVNAANSKNETSGAEAPSRPTSEGPKTSEASQGTKEAVNTMTRVLEGENKTVTSSGKEGEVGRNGVCVAPIQDV